MFKQGDKIICLTPFDYGITYEVKYVLANSVVVNDEGIDFPIRFENCVLYSPLIKELL